jgi:hypothetical protein
MEERRDAGEDSHRAGVRQETSFLQLRTSAKLGLHIALGETSQTQETKRPAV